MAFYLPWNTKLADPPLNSIQLPANGDTSADVKLRFQRPDNNGLPIWGPGNAGITILQRVKSRTQTGYYSWIFYGPGDAASPGNADIVSNLDKYWGFQPWPPAGAGGTTHLMEVAANSSDITVTVGGGTLAPQHGQWVVVMSRLIFNGDSSKTMRYYPRMPAVDNANVIEYGLGSGYGASEPPASMLMVGDNSWFNGFQHERGAMDLSHQIIYPYVLTEAQGVTQAADMTSPAHAGVWSFIGNFQDVDDLSCKAGTGHGWEWADTSNKGTFVLGGGA